MSLSKLGALCYGVLCYVLFLGTFLYPVGFVMGFVVPKNIDTVGGALASTTRALLVNGGILGLFAVQHTVMARHGFKRSIAKLVPPSIKRSTFVLVTCLILIALFYCWQPLPTVAWEVSSPLWRNVLHGVAITGFLGVVAVTFLIFHFELFGLKQVCTSFSGCPHRRPSFQVRSIYRISRHPLVPVLLPGLLDRALDHRRAPCFRDPVHRLRLRRHAVRGARPDRHPRRVPEERPRDPAHARAQPGGGHADDPRDRVAPWAIMQDIGRLGPSR